MARDRSARRACRRRAGRAPRRRARSSLGSVGRPGRPGVVGRIGPPAWLLRMRRAGARRPCPGCSAVLARGRAGFGARRTQRSRGHPRRSRCRRGSAQGHLPALQDHAGRPSGPGCVGVRAGRQGVPRGTRVRPTEFGSPGDRGLVPRPRSEPGRETGAGAPVEPLLVGTTQRSSLGLVPQAGRQPHADGPASLRTDRHRIGTPAVTAHPEARAPTRRRAGSRSAGGRRRGPGDHTSERCAPVRGAGRWRRPGAGGVLAVRGQRVPSAGSPRPREVAPGPTVTIGGIRTERRPGPLFHVDQRRPRRGVWSAGRRVSRRRLCWPVPRVLALAWFGGLERARWPVLRLLACADGAGSFDW